MGREWTRGSGHGGHGASIASGEVALWSGTGHSAAGTSISVAQFLDGEHWDTVRDHLGEDALDEMLGVALGLQVPEDGTDTGWRANVATWRASRRPAAAPVPPPPTVVSPPAPRPFEPMRAPEAFIERAECAICRAIGEPGWVTPQTGATLPSEMDMLHRLDGDERDRLLKCPRCGGYFRYAYDTDNSPGICEYEGLWPLTLEEANKRLGAGHEDEREEIARRLEAR
jgi:hypothetical protein